MSLAGGDSSVNRVAMLNPIEHSGVGKMADLLSAITVPEPLEHLVLEVSLEVGVVLLIERRSQTRWNIRV